MITSKLLYDDDLAKKDLEKIVGTFIRKNEDEKLRRRWKGKLAQDHHVLRHVPADKKAAVIRKLLFTVMALAASALIVISIFINFQGIEGPDALAEELAATGLVSVRSGASGGSDKLRLEISANFESGNYQNALEKSLRLIEFDEATGLDHLNLGIIHLQSGDAQQALVALRQLMVTYPVYRIEATYFQGLALLKLGRIEQALSLLGTLPQENSGTYYDRAQIFLAADW